jgi:predicted transposase YbfD/YdcC
MKITVSFQEQFSSLTDRRVKGRCSYKFHDILAIALLATICGADGWEEMDEFAEAQQGWLKTAFDLSEGTPCADTFRRVISSIRPDAFQKCFTEWMHALVGTTEGKLVAIDGKTARGSFDRASEKSPLHVVRAWCRENHLVLGQVATDAKSNEITAIPTLLKMLDLEGATVTIDAMGTQKSLTKDIVERGADYILNLKKNHPTLFKEVDAFFNDAGTTEFASVPHSYEQTIDQKHGRYEVRRAWCSTALDRLPAPSTAGWANLASITLVSRERTIQGKTSHERAYYLSSLSHGNAKKMLHAIRGHWSIENPCHWNLDMAFREDESRIHKDHGPENMALLRSLALNLLKQADFGKRVSIVGKRKMAGWNHEYLLRILSGKV